MAFGCCASRPGSGKHRKKQTQTTPPGAAPPNAAAPDPEHETQAPPPLPELARETSGGNASESVHVKVETPPPQQPAHALGPQSSGTEALKAAEALVGGSASSTKKPTRASPPRARGPARTSNQRPTDTGGFTVGATATSVTPMSTLKTAAKSGRGRKTVTKTPRTNQERLKAIRSSSLSNRYDDDDFSNDDEELIIGRKLIYEFGGGTGTAPASHSVQTYQSGILGALDKLYRCARRILNFDSEDDGWPLV
eukprot:SAG31_NODE_14142_length_825_cov_1.055096_1_plen_251_part_01